MCLVQVSRSWPLNLAPVLPSSSSTSTEYGATTISHRSCSQDSTDGIAFVTALAHHSCAPSSLTEAASRSGFAPLAFQRKRR